MNLKKEALQSQSEKAAVRALIEVGFEVSPQKNSLPNIDSWVITQSKKVANKEISRIKKKAGLPPTSRISSRTTRNSSSLCKSSKESNNFRMPLVSLAYKNEERPKSRLLLVKQPKIRSSSLGDGKSSDKSIDVCEIKKAFLSLIIKNNLLTRLKKKDSKKLSHLRNLIKT